MQHATPSHAGFRAWEHDAIARIEADFQRSADTHLIALPLPGLAAHGIDLYLKDESTHPTGSLKHRLARSLFLYALCNGWLREGSTVVEASSGSTAVSEAYFARLLGLPFVAVMPRSTSPEKIAAIDSHSSRSMNPLRLPSKCLKRCFTGPSGNSDRLNLPSLLESFCAANASKSGMVMCSACRLACNGGAHVESIVTREQASSTWSRAASCRRAGAR